MLGGYFTFIANRTPGGTRVTESVVGRGLFVLCVGCGQRAE